MINSKKAQRTFGGGDRVSKISVFGGVLLKSSGGLEWESAEKSGETG